MRLRSSYGLAASLAAALVALLMILVVTRTGDVSSETPAGDPDSRLGFLGREWLQRPATITYRTTNHPLGEATSPHQCLRQMVGGAIDRQTGLQMCLREGEMRLVWDPPDRWRMDVSSPTDTFTLISSPAASELCRKEGPGALMCVDRTSEEIEKKNTPFGMILASPEQILSEIGGGAANAVRWASSRTIAGLPTECFSASTSRQNVEWCYSKDGLLLAFAARSGEGASISLEATHVSASISAADFTTPPG